MDVTLVGLDSRFSSGFVGSTITFLSMTVYELLQGLIFSMAMGSLTGFTIGAILYGLRM